MRRVAALLALALLAACAQQPRQSLFVVVPDADGRTGAVAIDDGKRVVILDRPNAAAQIVGGALEQAQVDDREVQAVFGPALAARPILPARFRLFFVLGGDTLTPDSESEYTRVFDDIRARGAYEVEVVGHTDTMGTDDFNRRLSQQRAAAIRDRLVRDGLRAEAIAVIGRGEADLVVKTADETPEPRNRRVEITIR